MVRAVAALAVAASLLLVLFPAQEDGAQANACRGGNEPFTFETHEVYDNIGTYLQAIELAAEGKAVTFATTPSGEAHELEYPGLLKGPQWERVDQEPDPSLRIPPTLLKSIVWVESRFAHAHSDVPWGGVGRVLRSFDCGFGLGQITTGMRNETGNPSAKQALVGTHFLFNVAEAAAILADKWNSEFLPIAGNGDPAALEDWYYAIWAYNGFVHTNHPLYDRDHQWVWLNWLGSSSYPFRDPLRGDVWHCDDEAAPTWNDSGDGTPWFVRGDYTYPEMVYGCMRHPPEYPSRLYDDETYRPKPSQVSLQTQGSTQPAGAPAGPEEPIEPEDPNEGPTEPVEPEEPGEGPPEPVEPEEPSEGGGGEVAAAEQALSPLAPPAPYTWPQLGPDGVPRLWQPVDVNMPDLQIPAVVGAFLPDTYASCADGLWLDQCGRLSFPTSFPEYGIQAHVDPTPAADATLLDQLLGRPHMAIVGPSHVGIAIEADGLPGSVALAVINEGTWIAPYRIYASHPWIVVRRSGGSGRLHGGVAIGADTTVVVYAPANVTRQGHVAQLEVTLDPEHLPSGDVEGYVLIEPLFGEGEARRIVVRAGPSVTSTTESDVGFEFDLEIEPEPGDEPEAGDPETLDHRLVVPGLAADRAEADESEAAE